MGSLMTIDQKHLNRDQYFNTLLEEGLRLGTISHDTAQQISWELMAVFKELMRQYTKGESATLRTETAQSLMESILYVVDQFLMSYPFPQEALRGIQETNMSALYERALEHIKGFVRETKALYDLIEEKRISVPNLVYEETFRKALPDFFLKYDIRFAAHDTVSDLDYPLTFDDMSMKGIAYIYHYLKAFQLENDFCRKFSNETIISILKANCRARGLDYRATPINLFQTIFHNFIFSALLGKYQGDLFISPIELEIIESQLKPLNQEKLQEVLLEALEKAMDYLKFEKNLVVLARSYCTSILPRLSEALKAGTLANMMTLEEPPASDGHRHYSPGAKMSNPAFRFVYNKITKATTVSEKLQILNKFVQSLWDFLDLLRADCFFKEEYLQVFDSLGNTEISILAAKGLKNYLSREEGLMTFIEKKQEYSHDWELYFAQWLGQLDRTRLQKIVKLVDEHFMKEMI